MVKSCSAYKCTNRHSKHHPGIHFFRFPFSRPDVLRKWCDAMRRRNWFPSTTTYLCSKHFLPEDFLPRVSGVSTRLKPDAVPSQFDFTPYKGKKKQDHVKLNPLVRQKEITDYEEEAACLLDEYILPDVPDIITRTKRDMHSTSKTTPEILRLTVTVNNPTIDHLDNMDERQHNLTHEEKEVSDESSDTETSSETEEMCSEVPLIGYSKNSEKILKQKLDNMIVHYERTRERMEFYRERYKLCLKQVSSLEKIIDNLKEINSVGDSH